jgi:hypothetical protein
MKKVLFAIAILFAVNGKAQDTTYSHSVGLWQKNDLYMSIRTKVNDSATYNRYWTLEKKKRRKKDRVFSIVTTTIFVGLSAWFWSGYHQ